MTGERAEQRTPRKGAGCHLVLVPGKIKGSDWGIRLAQSRRKEGSN